MRYLALSQDPDITNPIDMGMYDTRYYRNDAPRELFEQSPSMMIGYFNNLIGAEKPDIFYSPSFLLSDRLKQLLEKYEPQLPIKPLQCFPYDRQDPETVFYWHPFLEKVDCLDEQSERYPNGWMKRVVLKEEAIQGKQIFLVDGVMEYMVIVSLELAESMLRRSFWGMKFAPVEVAARV